jgi:hypothetical protein
VALGDGDSMMTFWWQAAFADFSGCDERAMTNIAEAM